MPDIFVSHASGDDDCYVDTFVQELCDAIRDHVDPTEPTRAFQSSRHLDATGAWRPEVAAALNASSIFVALCTERYFLSPRCGREWWAFADRVRRYEADAGQRTGALIAVPWSHEGTPYAPPGTEYFGDLPDTTDVRQLARLRIHRPAYRRLLDRLARHIVTATQLHDIRAYIPLPAAERMPNAFDLDDAYDGATGVRFLVAAGRRDEMEGVRADLTYYGSQRLDWTPFLPSEPEPVAHLARDVAADHVLSSEVSDDVEGVADLLAKAGDANDIVVLLVDAWAARLEHCRAALAEVDRHSDIASAVIVPVSADDPETTGARVALDAGLSRVLVRHATSPEQLYRMGPDSAAAFDDELGDVLEQTRNLLFRVGTVRRTAPGDPPPHRPILEGP